MAASVAKSQEYRAPEPAGGAWFLGIGASGVDARDVDRRFEQLGFPSVGRTMLALGGGGYGVTSAPCSAWAPERSIDLPPRDRTY
jgi:hypothetical protein